MTSRRSPGAGFRALLSLIGPGASTRWPIVPRTSGHLALTEPPGDC